jgi:hypothetical protein
LGATKDFLSYLGRLVGDAIFRAVAIADAIAFLVKLFVPPAYRPLIPDESWAYLIVLVFGFVIAAYRIDQNLRSRLSTERSALCKDLRGRLIRLKFTIERRNKTPIPLDQILEIQGLAKDIGDEYVIDECGEMKDVLQRNYDSRQYLVDMFEDARRDYDSVRARVDFALDRIEKIVGPVKQEKTT